MELSYEAVKFIALKNLRRRLRMRYLVAKDKNKHGCYTLKTTHGELFAHLKRELNKNLVSRGIQIVTISSPTAYGEYAAYHFAKNEGNFKKLVLKM